MRRVKVRGGMVSMSGFFSISSCDFVSPTHQAMVCCYCSILQAETLRGDIQALAREFERDVDRREAMIELLQKELDDAEAQHSAALHLHLKDVDSLLEIQQDRLNALDRDFLAALRTLESEFARKRKELTGRHDAMKLELQHLLNAVKEDEANKTNAAVTEFEQLRESMKRRNLERIHILQSDMDGVIETLERAFEAAHLAYLQATDARTQDFKALSERGQHDTAMNERQQKALRRLNRLLQVWRSRMSHNVKESESRNDALQTERDSLARHLDKLKASMARARDCTMAKLKALCVGAQETKAALSEQVALAQRILTLVETLQPLETAEEKADPFKPARTMHATAAAAAFSVSFNSTSSSSSLPLQQQQQGDNAAGSSNGPCGNDDGEEELPSAAVDADSRSSSCDRAPLLDAAHTLQQTEAASLEAQQLSNFFARLNKVQLDAHALQSEKARLKAEAAQLRALLGQYNDATKTLPPLLQGTRMLPASPKL